MQPTWQNSLAAAAIVLLLFAPLLALGLPDSTGGMSSTPPLAWRSLLVSVAVSSVAATLALVAGSLLAAALWLTRIPGRALWLTLLLVPFLAPGTAWAMGQVYCYGAGGLVDRWLAGAGRPLLTRMDAGHYLSATLVLAEIHAPLALLLVGRGLARLPAAGWDAARLTLSGARLLRWSAGALKPELAAAWLLSLALSLGNFSAPHVLQCRLYPIEVYMRLTNYLDRAGAAMAACPLLAIALAAAGLAAWLCGPRRASLAATSAPINRGRPHSMVVGGLAVYLIVTSLGPLAALVSECRSVADFLVVRREAWPETQNTLEVALAAALLTAIAGAVVGAWLAERRGGMAEALALAPLGMPALVLGLAYARFYNHDWPIDLAALGDGPALITLGLTARAWPFATRLAMNGFRRQPPQWGQAAALAGMGYWRRWLWIRGPLMAESVAAAAVLAFVLAVGEVELSQMLCAPGGGTLALRLFTFLHFGPIHQAANLALLQLMLAVTPVLAYSLLTNRYVSVV